MCILIIITQVGKSGCVERGRQIGNILWKFREGIVVRFGGEMSKGRIDEDRFLKLGGTDIDDEDSSDYENN